MPDGKTKSAVPSPDRPVPAEFDLICENCGYSLVGLIHSTRCPECGESFDPNQLPLARVPWLYRVRRGWFATYRDTVLLILKGPQAFAADLVRPVKICAQDAARFRSVTGWIASLPILVLGTCLGLFLLAQGKHDALFYVPLAVGAFAATKFFIQFASDIPTFIWRGPNRTNPHELSPLQNYASAPLSLLWVPGMLAVFLMAAKEAMPWVPMEVRMLASATACLTVFLLMVSFLYIAVKFMRVATDCSQGRAVALGLYLPIHWCLIAIIALLVGGMISGLGIVIGGNVLAFFGLLPD